MANLTPEQKAARAAARAVNKASKAGKDSPGVRLAKAALKVAAKVEVEVKRGRRIDHDGQTYLPGAKFRCTTDERDRFLRLGSVVGAADVPFGNGPTFGHENDARVVKAG